MVETKTISGIEIFSVGTWTDSKGQKLTLSESDLDDMVRSFHSGTPTAALKVGHTSDAFNTKLARAMGVPITVLMGEGPDGNGQAALGKMVRLMREGDKLVASFDDVPAQLAAMIEDGMYNAVSSELELDGDNKRIVGVALLGAEHPAIKNLAPLEQALVYQDNTTWLTFVIEKDETGMIDKLVNALLARKAGYKFSQPTRMSLEFAEGGTMPQGVEAVYEALGLPVTATLEEVLAAIQTLKGGNPEEEMIPDNKDTTGQFAEHPEFIKLQTMVNAQEAKVKEQDEYIKKLEHKDKVMKFQAMATAWKVLPGTAAEVAEELATIEEKAGPEVAQAMVSVYDRASKASIDSNVLQSIGTSRKSALTDEAKDAFQDEVDEYAKENKLDFNKALAHFSMTKPGEFAEYRRRVRASVNGQ